MVEQRTSMTPDDKYARNDADGKMMECMHLVAVPNMGGMERKKIDRKDMDGQADEWDKKIHALSQSDGTFGWGHVIKGEDTIHQWSV